MTPGLTGERSLGPSEGCVLGVVIGQHDHVRPAQSLAQRFAMGLRGYPVLASAMVAGISRPSPDTTMAAMFANAKETSRKALSRCAVVL